ncbi:MAG: bifunctional serine/threonine-protein kinase/formylglycine-generating enzyme family protein [Candidatus Cloacimonetes bacterium]|nr:bifunctional serine/threonine-protein kinase/formylglycine-generating enzyme family protein [Candidatus Cloacimonadota bacterium]
MSEPSSLNSYQVIESIHRSRRFSLYLASKHDSGKEVLIKTPDPVRSKDVELINALISEAETCKQLNHPNIRACYESYSDIGSAFLIGEYIPGVSLAKYLTQMTSNPSLDTILVWITDLLEALAHAHKQGITHLNLNPHNLIITPDNHMKVIGFGKDKAAWMNGELQDYGFHPILFIAPELFQASIALPASDIYSVAVLAYLCICNVMPWRIDYTLGSVQQKKQSLSRAVIMPEKLGIEVPDWLYVTLLNCLKLDPHYRYQSAAELLEAIDTKGSVLPNIIEEENPEPEVEIQPEKEEEIVFSIADEEPALIVSAIAEPEPESIEELDIPIPEREPVQAIEPSKPITPPTPKPEIPKPPAPKPSPMFAPTPLPSKDKQIEAENRSLSKTFKILLGLSLAIVVFSLFKYFIFGSKPRFKLPADVTDVEIITANPAEENKALSMVLVPADTLVMGSISPEADDDEFPLLTIKLSQFYISPQEITQNEWLMVFPTNPSKNKDNNLPVDNVSFYDVIEFCNAKSLKDGYRACYDYYDTEVVCNYQADGYRLPTEAEWEAAAKSAKQRDFNVYSGSNVADKVGWYNSNSEANVHPGGQKDPNSLGLFDMSGNMFEWVWNWYAPYSYRVSDLYKGPETGIDKVIRGGSWYHSSSEMRVTNRNFAKPYTKNAFIGFRVVRSAGS